MQVHFPAGDWVKKLQTLAWVLVFVPLVFLFLEPAKWLDFRPAVAVLHFLHLLFVGGVILFLHFIGGSLLRRLGWLPEDSLERILLSVSAGFCVSVFALFLLATLGLLKPLLVWPGAMLALVAARRVVASGREKDGSGAALPSDAEEGWNQRDLRSPTGIAAWAFGGVLALLFAGDLLEALHPSPRSPDALAHNLAYALLFADAGGFVVTEHNPLYFALSGYWELFLAGLALFTRSEVSLQVLAQTLHLGLGLGLTVLAVVALVRRLGRGGWWTILALGLFAAVLFAGMPINVGHIRDFPYLPTASKSDLAVSALQMAAVLMIFEAITRRGSSLGPLCFLGGVLLGVSSGIKLTGGIAAGGLLAVLWLAPPEGLGVPGRLRATAWMMTGLFAALAPLLLKNWVGLGNPVYPLFPSFFGRYDNPLFFETLHGFGKRNVAETAYNMRVLLFPSGAFLLAGGVVWRGLARRQVLALLAGAMASVGIIAVVFSKDFPPRYALFIPALMAVCTACAAGGVLGRIRAHQGTGGLFSHPVLLPAACAAAFLLALLPIHLDNHLKRAFRTVVRTPRLAERPFRMNRVSRFQASWPGKLPQKARPMTFYRPEVLYAFGGGWRPVVAFHSPDVIVLFASERDPALLEKKLVERRISHFYFESDPELSRFPVRPDAFVEYLRKREPLWRDADFEIYTLRPAEKSP